MGQRRYRTVELEWIPVSGGRKLAARLFLPLDAQAKPVPCLLEYLPYRRRDGTRFGDDMRQGWFAENGYACARVDIAGTGDSTGTIEDEYVKLEQDDALEVIAWLASQPWCSGSVGMLGHSWGGFNSLQVAARRPPALKAIVTMYSTVDRYGCDAHYLGGCVINDNFSWGGAFFNYAALPPDPAQVGEDQWRALWKQRLESHSMFPATWLKHQRRDAFWRHGSVCENYDDIACPVMTVGGWLDGYTPAVLRLLENVRVPVKGLIGPWGHKEPHIGVPGPAIDFLGECKRWFDRWLKGIETGVERDPDMRLYVMDHAAPAPHFTHRDGKWLGFSAWPPREVKNRRMNLNGASINTGRNAKKRDLRSLCSPQTTGMKAQEWCPYGQARVAAEGATDQREDDSLSLCYDSKPLDKPITLLGEVQVKLRIAANRPQALVAVRLNDIAPDGTSAMVTHGVLNLAHRKSHENPEPLKPGQFYDVVVTLKPCSQVFPKGHVMRLAVSSTYWPMVWPSPEAVTLTIDAAKSHFDFPALQAITAKNKLAFAPNRHAEPGPVTVVEPDRETRNILQDIATEITTFDIKSDDGRFIIEDTGTEVTSSRNKTYSIHRTDPTKCVSVVHCTQSYKRSDWDARVESEVQVRCDTRNFYMKGWVRAYDGGKLFMTRDYDETIARDNM